MCESVLKHHHCLTTSIEWQVSYVFIGIFSYASSVINVLNNAEHWESLTGFKVTSYQKSQRRNKMSLLSSLPYNAGIVMVSKITFCLKFSFNLGELVSLVNDI